MGEQPASTGGVRSSAWSRPGKEWARFCRRHPRDICPALAARERGAASGILQRRLAQGRHFVLPGDGLSSPSSLGMAHVRAGSPS